MLKFLNGSFCHEYGYRIIYIGRMEVGDWYICTTGMQFFLNK